jgi:hypothetical protein
MTATLPVEAVYVAVLALFALAWYARWRPCTCEKCSYHQNEVRVARLRKADEDHDFTHRNWGKCANRECPRNERRP